MSTSVDLALVDRYPEGWSGEVLEFVCAIDLEGEIIAANEGMARLTGYSRDQLLRSNIRDMVHDKGWDPLSEHATEIGILNRNGRVTTLAISQRWLSENGKPVALEITGCSKSAARSNQLHRLSKTNYDSLEHAFDDYLKTGCRLLGLAAGMVLQFAGSAATLIAAHGATGLATQLPINSTPCATLSARLRTVTRSAPSDGVLHSSFETCIGGPIVAGSDFFGSLVFASPYSSGSRSFSTDEKDFVESLAKGLGSVVTQHGTSALDGSAETVLAEVVRLVESQRPGARCSVVKGNGDAPNEAALSAPISFANGVALGHLVLHGEEPAERERDQQLLQSAARIAAIAIEQQLTTARLECQARHDSLTGLPNRVHFTTLLESALADSSRSCVLAVLFIDLDRFKQINDTLGHAMGDLLIAEIGHRLRRLLSDGDFAGRMGGDEFTIALLGQPDEQTAIQSARECLNVLRAPHRLDDHELFVTASIGVALCPSHGVSAAELLRNADHAMYRAKKNGKNDLEVFFTDARISGLQRFRLENALRRALDRDEFDLLYQPLVNVNGRVEGLEALLTWKHPVYGTIGPKQFIPIAEETGLIIPIGSWVIREACLQGARWRKSGYRCVRISVNVSTLQFGRRDFVETVAAALAFSGLPADCLELELTESYVMRDLPGAAHRLSQIRDLGVSISIDDFGTGYSSLSYLNKLPLDSLKIDQSFLRNLQEPDGSLPVVQSIVRLAHSMNLTVVAEGVETIEELELVRLLGCDKVQGHLYGRSLNRVEAEALLARPDGMAQIARRL